MGSTLPIPNVTVCQPPPAPTPKQTRGAKSIRPVLLGDIYRRGRTGITLPQAIFAPSHFQNSFISGRSLWRSWNRSAPPGALDPADPILNPSAHVSLSCTGHTHSHCKPQVFMSYARRSSVDHFCFVMTQCLKNGWSEFDPNEYSTVWGFSRHTLDPLETPLCKFNSPEICLVFACSCHVTAEN